MCVEDPFSQIQSHITKMFARVKNRGARNLWSFIHFIRNHKWNDEITASLLLQSRKYNWKMHPCQGAWLQDGWDCLPKWIHVVKNKEQSSIKYKATTKSQMKSWWKSLWFWNLVHSSKSGRPPVKKHTVVRHALCFWQFALFLLSLATHYREPWYDF